jgi:hypothetical protein
LYNTTTIRNKIPFIRWGVKLVNSVQKYN